MDDLATAVSAGEASTGGAPPSSEGAISSPAEISPDASPSNGESQVTDTVAPSTSESATPDLDSILQSIPEDDSDLEQTNTRDVEGLRNQRQQLRVLSETIKALRPLESFQSLAERGAPDAIQKQLERLDSLITPVVDPNTQQPVVDEHGYQAFTTLPFVESMEQEQQGFAVQLFNDVLGFKQVINGQPVTLEQRYVQEVLGLDPNRLEEYRNIDALAAQDTGQNLQEQLAQIPAEYHELFKSLPPKVREDFLARDEEVRNWELKDRQEAFLDRQQKEARAKQDADAQQRYQQELRASVERAQDADIESQFSEGLSSIMDDIASKVTFSSDAKQDAALKAIVGAVLLPLRDSSNHAHMKPLLEALGVQMDSAFLENLTAYTQSRRNWKALDLAGRKAQADSVLKDAAAPRARVMTKASQIALKVAEALGGQVKAKAEVRNGQLQEASQIRPTVDGLAPNGSTNLVEMARQAGVNLNDGQAVNSFIMQQLGAGRAVGH